MSFNFPNKKERESIWIKLGLGAILIRIILGFQPQWCEVIYSRGIYPWIRSFFDHTLGLLPFAAIYLFDLILVIWLIKISTHFIKSVFIEKEGIRGKGYGKSIVAFFMGLIFWFLFLWGYNYARIPMSEQIGLEVPESMNFDAIWEEAQYIKQTCIEARQKIPSIDTNVIPLDAYPSNLEEVMRTSLKEVLKEYRYDFSGHVRGRFVQPDGILLRFNSSGVYFPFTGEGHVDNGLHHISKPFTIAHELGHGYGFGSEDVCNFLGFLACIRSQHPAIQYSGYLMYWRYVYGTLMGFMTEQDYQIERATISRGMHNDMEAIYAKVENYPAFIPFLQPAVYDVFLKVQGVEDGIESYDRMILLVSSWRKKYH
ncbi:DUF3810 domain-containing protein [Aureispira sp. CCB-QB1]|uniref:DUF3810 domain-containing protein n=1 Tax=Aureispira sp. CCB-QB1 TaxID=1313421 RepID=UPI0006988D76|nr:DUF3810 domain-containing protein [Aureispira sp. CCB-QB1]